ncbi:MAG: hypothetical protein KBG11_11260, partial [Bacteroidia bacterium]|nr:hypothetical protein [Bacteroidia bacterium]
MLFVQFMVTQLQKIFSTYLQHVIDQDLINSVNFAITNMQTQSVIQYLSWLSQRWGQTAYNSVVGNLQYSNQISLSNWHLYGSSRLGIKQTDTTLYSREITINGFDTLGNVLVNEVLDSTYLGIDTANYSHTLATKQYELTNHLGNVLATVLDRKTLNQADVVSANNYYPYHSNMQTWSVPNKTAYNFGGANGQEKDNEIRPDLYGALYWEFDSRLGGNGRWNVDPKPHPGISPYATYAGNPVMFVDVLGDTVKT